MVNVLAVVVGISGLAISYVLLPAFWSEMDEHRGARTVDCPEAKHEALARTSAWRGAARCMGLPVRLQVLSCSLWPERSGCAGKCLAK